MLPSASPHPLPVSISQLLGSNHELRVSAAQYSSGDKQITVETYVPDSVGAFPAVIALHGSGGIREGWADNPARLLAARGFAVFVPHYFERTGDVWVDDRTIRQKFPVWMQTIADAITWTTQQPKVDAARVALLGFSLGGYLALSVASQDRRVSAVIEYFGGLPQQLEQHAGSLPPILILHGEADPTVPVSEARKLQRLCEQHDVKHEVQIYPGVGHGFSGPTLFDAGLRTLKFLNEQLR